MLEALIKELLEAAKTELRWDYIYQDDMFMDWVRDFCSDEETE